MSAAAKVDDGKRFGGHFNVHGHQTGDYREGQVGEGECVSFGVKVHQQQNVTLVGEPHDEVGIAARGNPVFRHWLGP